MKVINTILRPVSANASFFLIFIFLISQTALKTLLVDLSDISSDIASLEWLCLSALISYVFTCIIYLTKSKIVKWALYAIGIVLFSVYVFLWLVFGTSLSPTILQIVGETNIVETSEFVRTFVFSLRGMACAVVILLLFALCWIIEHKVKPLELSQRMTLLLGGVLMAVLVIGASKSRVYYTLLRTSTTGQLDKWTVDNSPYYPMDMVTTLVYSLHSLKAVSHDIDISREKARQVYDTDVVINPADSTLKVVFILGESYIKHHAAIYGYPLPTTPNMTRETARGNLFAFNSVVSPFSITTDAEKNVFSLNSLASHQYWYDCPMFTTVFKRAGFDVYMWDIQRTWDSNAAFTFSVNSYLYDKETARLSYTATNAKKYKYDGDMVDDFFSTFEQIKGRSLVVFHLIGQHVDAHERYPNTKQFDRFKASDIKRSEKWLTSKMRQEIAWYDNATYYNDYVIGKVFDKFRKSNAVVVYLSDHGEEIYDYRPSKGRKATPVTRELMHCQFAIPMVVWCSDRYKAMHHGIIKSVEESVDKPMTSDNVGQLLLHLAGIATPFYNSSHDILSRQYSQGTIVLGNGTKYIE